MSESPKTDAPLTAGELARIVLVLVIPVLVIAVCYWGMVALHHILGG